MTAALGTTTTVRIEPHECHKCGVIYGLTPEFERRRRDDHKTFYCPNGHPGYYPQESNEERLKRLLKNAEDAKAALRAERDQIEASRRAYKGQATRLRNRAIAGECPLCGKHLAHLERHMSRVHPDEKPESDEA